MGKIEKFKYANHEEWKAIRRKYVGGSEAGSIIGLNPYKSAYALWAEKTGRIPEFEGNMATKVGTYMEDFIAHLFAEETGKKVQKVNTSLHNTDYPFAIANIDRKIVGEKAGLEIKNTTSLPVIKHLKNCDFPEMYLAQCTHYLAVTGLERWYLAVLVNCKELKLYTLERDEAEIKALMDAEKEFWKFVQMDVAPMPDGADSTSDALLSMYPNSTDDAVDLVAFSTELEEYMALSDQIKNLTKMKDEKANIIKEFMKDAGYGRNGKYSVSYKSQERRTFDTKRFEKENQSLDLSDYYKVSTSRVFKVTKKGE